MAAIQIGNVTGAIYQAERPLHLNPDGSGQQSLTYKCSGLAAAAITIPAYLSPNPYHPSLKCYETDVDYEHGGVVKVTSIYKGVIADDPISLAQHDYARTTAEAPIETNPKFAIPIANPPVTPAALAIIDQALQTNQQQLPDGQNAQALLLFDLKRRGIESYLKPGSVYKRTYVSADIPSGATINDVGKIKAPPSPCPAAPPDQNYLYLGCTWNKQAGVVTINEEYQLSGPGGWRTDLYETA